MSLRPNVSFAFPRRARWSFCLAVIWSRAASVPSTWLSSAPGVPSPTLKRTPLRLGRITRAMLRTRKRLHLKKRVQEPPPKLSLPRLRPPTEGRGGPRDGSALYADNVRSITTSPCSIVDTPLLAYTSLLRITTTLPPKEENETKAEDAGEANPPTNDNNNSNNATPGSAMSRLTAMVSRPLRGVARNRTDPPTPSELERGGR